MSENPTVELVPSALESSTAEEELLPVCQKRSRGSIRQLPLLHIDQARDRKVCGLSLSSLSGPSRVDMEQRLMITAIRT